MQQDVVVQAPRTYNVMFTVGARGSPSNSSLTSLSNFAVAAATGGVLSIAGTASNYGGVIGANGATVQFTVPEVDYGHLTIGSHGTMAIAGAARLGDILFTDGTGTLRLDNPAAVRSAIGGFQPGDVLDFRVHAVSFASPAPYSGDSLHLLVNGAAANLTMPGAHPATFHLGTAGADKILTYTSS